MILLPQQFQMLVFHLLMGTLLGLLYNIQNTFVFICLKGKCKNLFEFLFFTLFLFLFYFALYQLNGGITQLYCILLFVLGIVLYFQFYFITFNPFISSIMKLIFNLLKKTELAIWGMTVIINNIPLVKKWRKYLGNHTKSNEKKT